MANQFLSLALFLMLLSFFIVMNAASQFNEYKSRPVIDSIALAFSGQSIGAGNVSVVESVSNNTANKGDTLELIEGLFNAHVSGFESSRNRLGTVMHVRTSVGEFEKAIDLVNYDYAKAMVDERGSFVLSMITVLRSDEIGVPYRVDIILNIPEDSATYQKENPNDFMENLKRVSGFAEKLESFGLPKRMMNIGLSKGDAGFVDLYFYRYKPFDMIEELEKSEGL